MSLEYHLLCKNRYDNIISNLKSVIENYDDIFSYASELNININKDIPELSQLISDKHQVACHLNNVIQLKSVCIQKITQLCDHEFVTDMIDINPERSQNITFCRICEYTLE
jgi:hypothetical protein